MKHPVRIHLRSWLAVFFGLAVILAACKLNIPGNQPLSVTPASPALSPTPRSTPIPLSPTIVETVPPVGGQIPLQSPLTVYFSEKMDRLSVETGLSADFQGGFTYNWVDDSTLTLAPRSPLPAASRVTITLAATARSVSGLPLLAPITFSYFTPGPLKVTQVLPAPDSKDVSPDSAVVVAFDQPVVALGADPSSLPDGFTLEPAASGHGEWLNTSTYIFHGVPALSGGVHYSVHVNPALVSTAGMPLDAGGPDTSWAFATSLPIVEHILGLSPTDQAVSGSQSTPAPGADLLPDSQIEVAFNQPMDKASVESNFSFSTPSALVAGVFTWNEKFSVVTFKPASWLQRGADFKVTVGGQSRSNGGMALGANVVKVLHSVSDFSVLSTNFPNDSTRPQYTNIAITFNSPLADYSDADLKDLITYNLPPSSESYYLDNRTIYVNSNFLPGRQYTITFSSQLKDRFGQQLGQDYAFSFTNPPAAPGLQPATYQQVLFTTPDDPAVPVQAVNIDTILVSHGSVSTADFLRLQSDYDFFQKYFPPDLQTQTIHPSLPPNDNQTLSVDISDSPLSPGIYYTNITSPETQSKYDNKVLLVVSNVNLTFKMSATGVVLWAVDLRTHQPVAKMPLTLYDDKGAPLLSGTTDENGLWQAQFSAQDSFNYDTVILGQTGDDEFGLAQSSWDSGIEPYSFGYAMEMNGPSSDIYLYTDRPIYRPGDTVHFRGALRQAYDGRYTASALKTVTVNFNDPYGPLGQQKLSLSAFGTFTGDLSLPASATPGSYSMDVTDDSGSGSPLGYGLSFMVADYRKPEINLTVGLDPQEARSGQPITATINAQYFFGSPVADLPVSWSLYSTRSNFSIPQFTTGLQTSGWLPLDTGAYGSLYKTGTGRTGADGTLTLPLNDLNFSDTSTLTLEVTATESGGFPISARANATLHPDAFYVGVRPDAWVGQAGSSLGFSLLSVDWQKHPLSKPLQVKFEKVRWDRSEDGNGNYSFTPVYTPVDSTSVTTSADGKASVSFTPPDPGTYVLDVTSANAHTQALVWVSGAEAAAWPNLPYQQLELTADNENYKPGDTAHIFIPNPFNETVPALLTTERSTIKSVQVIDIPAGGYTFELRLGADDAPNIYVSATLLGPSGPDFRQGYIDLQVDPSTLTLNVDLKASPEKAKPGDTITLDLSVTDSNGKPVQGEFSMAVVDLAVLALADPNSQNIVSAYYNVQPLGVVTGLTDAAYIHRVFYQPGGRGGGSGEGPLVIRSKFPDTAYWKADILTDSQGKASISFKLPDNLTTWQVDTRGLTADTRVGQAQVRVVTTKDLLIRPQTQRFFVAGDHAELAAIVNNNTATALDTTIALQVDGMTLDDPARSIQLVSVPANGAVRVSWTGTVQTVDKVDPLFLVSAGSLQDVSRAVDGPIPVLRYSAPQTFSTAGLLNEAATRQEIIAVPRSFQPLGGELKVELSPSMAAVILSSLKATDTSDTPWSSEQIMSSLLPNTTTYQALQQSGLEDAALTARLQASLGNDLSHLMTFQADDGGFKWTTSSSDEDPYLSAYVLFGLKQVEESGFTYGSIDIGSVMERTRTYLLAAASGPDPDQLTDRDKLNRLVFEMYSLQTTGGLENLSYLVDKLNAPVVRDRLDPWAQALLAQAMTDISSSDSRAASLLNNLETTAIRSATGAHWESQSGSWMNPSTPLFTTAVVLSVLVDHNSSSPLLADAVRYLASQQGDCGCWGSSYETAWVILALDKYMHSTGELAGNFTFSASLNGASLAQGQASGPQNLTAVDGAAPLSGMNLTGANSLLVSRLEGPGSLYYRAILSVDRPVETAPALDHGIAISRQFLDCSVDPCQQETSYQLNPAVSGRISVHLTLTVPHDSYYLMVQDYIPAGTDILDSSLKTSQQGQPSTSVQQQFDPADPFGDGWGWWYFNNPQIYSDHILWSADYLPAGTYELTYTLIASLAGQYRVLPAHAWQAYFPEVEGTSAGAVFEIKP